MQMMMVGLPMAGFAKAVGVAERSGGRNERIVVSAAGDGQSHGLPMNHNRRGVCGGLTRRNERSQSPALASAEAQWSCYFPNTRNMRD